MASVRHKQKETLLTEVGRCLIGYVDGKKKFKYADGQPKEVKIRRRAAKEWFEAGWFSKNLLDDC